MLAQLLGAFGLVRASQHAAAEERLRKVEARAAKLAAAVEEARAESGEWRAKFGEADKRARDLGHEATRHAERLEKIKADLGAQLATARARVGEFQAMRQRLADAERDIAVARDHLMAIEVKLDILEGAANTLDARTRTVLASPSKRESGAPV